MNDNPFQGLVGDRAYRRRYSSHLTDAHPHRARRPDPTGKEYMLLEDIRLYALPYGRGTEDDFSVTLQPDQVETQELILNALPSTHYSHYQLSEAFRDYIEGALWHLVLGNLYLEIEYFRTAGSSTSPPIAFRIEILDANRIQKRLGKLYYSVPDPGPQDGNAAWSRERLDPNTLVAVSLPRRTRRTLDRALRTVRVADQDLDVMQSFTLGRHGTDSGFDFKTYNRHANDLVLRATREIGWTGRGLFTDDLLDPLKAWRAIQFARFVTELRETATGGLQQAISVAASKIGFKAELCLAGVLTETDLDQLEKDLREGTRPIAELLSPKAPS